MTTTTTKNQPIASIGNVDPDFGLDAILADHGTDYHRLLAELIHADRIRWVTWNNGQRGEEAAFIATVRVARRWWVVWVDEVTISAVAFKSGEAAYAEYTKQARYAESDECFGPADLWVQARSDIAR